MPEHLIYVRRSYKEATAADISDEMQEAACRSLLPKGALVRVISDSGGHQSGYTAARDGYQALLTAVRAGQVASIAVYDLSRLARNARLMLDLHHELERQNVPLIVANLPGATFDGATGRFMYGQLCLAAQLQRDLDSERMAGLQRRLFEDGRHRGHDPFGYRSRRDQAGRLVRPRQLEIDPNEAAVVRRVFRALAEHSYVAVAELLNREGVRRDGLWTRESVKDIARRGRMYLGYVVEKRGRDERPGRHPAILAESDYLRTMAAIKARTRSGNKPRPFRQYLLRGLVFCACGTRMRGEAHVQRGTDRRYYRCPRPGCPARRCPADVVEPVILERIAAGVLPDLVLDTARAELRRRLQDPETVLSGRQRKRLETRLKNLKRQHEWGDISDDEYRVKRDETRTILDGLPHGDRIRLFDAYRAEVLGLAQAVEAASPSQREELCHIVIDRVVVRDREIETLEWAHPVRVFFERQREYPQGDSNP
ncbi:MAG TPA: recombinase family protein [Candidatus Limnocylindrales bacterium]|nr:recombinase family protein [Candidatus Limnocylindrales bacterium]